MQMNGVDREGGPSAAPIRMRIPLPSGADPVQVAGGLNPGLPSWLPLNARAAEIGELGAKTVALTRRPDADAAAVVGCVGRCAAPSIVLDFLWAGGAGSASIADRQVEVPTRTYPLSSIFEAWTAPADGTRTVIVSG